MTFVGNYTYMKLNLKQKQKNPLHFDLFIVDVLSFPFPKCLTAKSVLPYNHS